MGMETERLNQEKRIRMTETTETREKGSHHLLIWLIVVLIIISIGSFVRSFIVQESADDAENAAQTAIVVTNRANDISLEGRDASLKTLDELHAILDSIKDTNTNEPDLQNQAIIDALEAIARIEGQLCGGRCPALEES